MIDVNANYAPFSYNTFVKINSPNGYTDSLDLKDAGASSSNK